MILSDPSLNLSEAARTKILDLIDRNEIKYVRCRRISDELKVTWNLKLNEQGFSEKWDTGGMFVDLRKTVFLSSEEWTSSGTPLQFSAEQLLKNEVHETGHVVDFCLGRPSDSEEFKKALKADMNGLPFAEDKKDGIMGRLLDEAKGHREVWANLFELSTRGACSAVGAKYCPRAMEVFNRQVSQLGLAPAQNEDLKGYAVDFMLNNHSSSAQFRDAWQQDLANFPYGEESKRKILGPLMDEAKGSREVWANFYAFATKGTHKNMGAVYFPRSTEVFNQICPEIGLGPICVEPYEYMAEIRGRVIPLKAQRLSHKTSNMSDEPLLPGTPVERGSSTSCGL